MVTVAAYIDGFNLYYGMKRKYGRSYLWLDVAGLVRRLRPGNEVVTVKYFTTIVRGEPEASANQINYLDALKAHSGGVLEVQVGWFRRRKLAPCRDCASTGSAAALGALAATKRRKRTSLSPRRWWKTRPWGWQISLS